MFSCIQMYFPCTRSSTCGTHCCSVTHPSPFVSAWPYCSSSGTDSWLMASTSASCFSRTCQVRKRTSVYVHKPHSFCHLLSTLCSAAGPAGDTKMLFLISLLYCNQSSSTCISKWHHRRLFFSPQMEDLYPVHANFVWVDDILQARCSTLTPWWVLCRAFHLSSRHSAAPSELCTAVITSSLGLHQSSSSSEL